MLETDEVRLLSDIGFIAATHGFDEPAMVIFDGVVAARPDQEAGKLGIALVHMMRGDLNVAIQQLKAIGPTDAALTFLALAKARTGDRSEAERILDNVARTSGEAAYSALAGDIREALVKG